MNLWFPADFARDFLYCTFGDGVGSIGALVFVGNLFLFVGILLGIFLLHMAVVAGVEANWLSEVRECPQV